MGIIEIEDMEFFAYHGCFASEQLVGNYFSVYARLETDCSTAANTDNIEDALNYQTAYEIIKKEMMKPSALLENVSMRILDALYNHFSTRLHHATIKIKKAAPPIGGKIKSVSVQLSR
ncbi:MAG: dihydroneopterin aldolase [Bacteroidales bacterium]